MKAAGGNSDERDTELELGRRTFPDAAAVFSWAAQTPEGIRDHCVVVPDTNVLAVPYELSHKPLTEISQVYQRLILEDRLLIPGQVAREFARVRIKKLGEMRASLSDRLSKIQTPPAVGSYPILRELREVEEAREKQALAQQALDDYKETVRRVVRRLDSWASTDPVLDMYRQLGLQNVIVDPEFDLEEVQEDLAYRRRNKIPPGYKDQAKPGGGMGDLLIWRSILQVATDRKVDLIFVTGEEKSDWWHRSAAATLAPRHELVEEFRRASGGRTYQMLSLPGLLDLFQVSQDVVDEVSRATWSGRQPSYAGHAIGLPDGLILVVRHDDRYGALQALEQNSSEEGASIKYQWWYQPDGSGRLVGELVHRGYGHAREGGSESPTLEVGPIELEWSVGGNGFGWIYFGPPGGWSDRYELAITNSENITEVRVEQLDFLRYQGN